MGRPAAFIICAALCAISSARADDFETQVSAVSESLSGDEAAAPPADIPESIDLAGQWGDGPRDQKPLGSCHDFAAVALLEAGWYRLYETHVRLSEADLFVRTTASRGPRSVIVAENGLLREDLRIALRTGVLPGDGYAELAARFKAERRRHPFAPLAGRRRVLEKLLPEAATPEAAERRDAVREALSPLTLEGPSGLRFLGSTVRTVLKGSAVSCRGRAKRRDVLLKHLAARQPVALGLLLNGVSDPDLNAHRDSLGGEHYLVVSGYERRPDGYSFTIRNSHGDAPDSKSRLTEADLCAVFGMTWLSAPGDER